MAVFIEYINVVAPVSVIEERYPGGMAAYKADCPNRTFCCDGHLTRIGFMGPPEVGEFLNRLIGLGLQPQEGKAWKDVAVVDQIFRRPFAFIAQ